MINFNTLDELWIEAAKYVIFKGEDTTSRAGDTREYLGFAARLNNPQANWLFNPVRKLSPHYAAGELLWYLSGRSDLDMICHYAPSYTRFSDDGVTARGAYGPRINHTIGQVVEMLYNKKDTRQAIIPIFEVEDTRIGLAGTSKDIPCTLNLQFFVRGGKLNMITTMRSNDIWLGMPYDIWCFTCIQQLVAQAIDVPLGWYQHQVGSLHVYTKQIDKLKTITSEKFTPRAFEWGPSGNVFPHNIRAAIEQEEWNRKNKTCSMHLAAKFGHHSLLSAVVAMASMKDDGLRAVEALYKINKNASDIVEYCETFYSTNVQS